MEEKERILQEEIEHLKNMNEMLGGIADPRHDGCPDRVELTWELWEERDRSRDRVERLNNEHN